MTKRTISETSPKRKTYTAPALEKGLDILELLAAQADGMNIGAITKKLDRSVGELFRMLAVLQQRGYVSVEPGSDRYRLTLKMFGLAHRFPPVKRLTSASAPILQRLSYDIEQSCHLVIYYEGRGHVVVQQDSPSERVFSVRLGAEAPLMNTCSGHLLLAFADENTRSQMLSRIPAHHPDVDGVDIDKMVRKVLSQGYESIHSAQAQGIQDIGYPVFDYRDQAVAALIVPFFDYLDGSHQTTAQDAHQLIKQAALDISTALGYEPS
ncbi:IclR family transcriptional regulator [Aliiglaciecola sp. 3_MG-2023]|uniref:IclR family transcriptional regulator n=1 Tax=Aliiglaciecola sp. 3_MG-2023 TaxID=3062644 RepID=UPI0026E47244|nr:IclR family transcriptional regulator [Aliiglaciecola sp. 3_MG-2023]MDO6693123.1 IclR family transcriptional regulator [Aliiglaciecola sp. 3_MG-2023]